MKVRNNKPHQPPKLININVTSEYSSMNAPQSARQSTLSLVKESIKEISKQVPRKLYGL